MNWAEFFSQGLTLLGTFNIKIGLFLFLINLIGEATALSVPYLLETTWLLAGYQFSHGVLPFWGLALMVLVAIAGRQLGELILFGVVSSGSTLVTKYMNRLKLKTDVSDATIVRLFRKINLLSPFWVALGRLLWLRIPLTLILGTKRQLRVLMLATVLSSLVYDATYITLGAVVGTTIKLEPWRIFLYFLAGLTVIYLLTFAIRRLLGSFARRKRANQDVPATDKLNQA